MVFEQAIVVVGIVINANGFFDGGGKFFL